MGLSGPDAYNWPVKVKKRVICNLNTDIVLQFKKSSGKEFHTLTERLTINERQGLKYKRSTDNLKIWPLLLLLCTSLSDSILHIEKPLQILNNSTILINLIIPWM